MRGVIGQRGRIDYPATGESEPGLAGEERMFFGPADAQRMRAAGAEAGVEKRSNVGRRYWAVADPALATLDLDQSFENRRLASRCG